MIPTKYDRDIRDLERKLRALKGLQRRERKAQETPKPRKTRAPRKPKRAPGVELYWDQLRAGVCIITGKPNPTIHHCHGGSMIDRGVKRVAGRKTNDWLVLPLAPELHFIGPGAIDGAIGGGVKSWELRNGAQADHLDALVRKTGVDVWKLAGVTK